MFTMNQTVLSGLFFAPSLRHVAPDFFGWTSWVNSVKNFFAVTDQAIEAHSVKLDLNNPQDFIDNYLMEIRATQDPSSTFYKENGEKNLKAIVGDLFFAGAETSSTTLSFAILYLCQNQEKQRKAQKELDLVVGSSHQISLSDKLSLPYIEAIVMETLRLSSIVPLGIPHQLIADTEFHGYLLPKGITLMPNLYTIHHDKKIWGEDANLFRPERFLDEDETRVVHNDALIPFSAGRRQCLGEGLARDTIFLFIASILQNFDIGPDPKSPVLDMETIPGILVEPKPFNFSQKRFTGTIRFASNQTTNMK
ncbi:Methyl farnesoate epoxidase [Orchesella cincta]|uniref:Methyl farnesoate epoxidase n=1 Tax=Orchesella cincta TaxID=48709 RepID=A0A1D2M8M6_ORCCI|nr:Methyl farnesoate epoxidase [Orchesella cincta]